MKTSLILVSIVFSFQVMANCHQALYGEFTCLAKAEDSTAYDLKISKGEKTFKVKIAENDEVEFVLGKVQIDEPKLVSEDIISEFAYLAVCDANLALITMEEKLTESTLGFELTEVVKTSYSVVDKDTVAVYQSTENSLVAGVEELFIECKRK